MHTALWLAAAGLILTLSSGCGMALHGMPGRMHGAASHTAETSMAGVIGQVSTEPWVVTLKVPALRVGEQAAFQLTVVDASTGRPQTGLVVRISARRAASGTPAHGAAHAGDAVVLLEATEVEPGTYAVTHAFGQPGTVEISATASADGMPSTTVGVTQEVRPAAGPGRGTGHGVRPLAVLGGAAMAIMMVIMLAGS